MDERAMIREAISPERTGKLVLPTARFGEVTVTASTMLFFPRGIIGLPHAQRFVFLHDETTPGPVFWLQSVDDPELAFLVCEPRQFFPDYEIELGPSEKALLGIEDARDAVVCAMLIVPADPERITANLRAPLVIHTETRTAVQLVLEGDRSPVRAPLRPAGEETGNGGDPCSS